MRAFVFTDKALARHAGRFVWLSVDTERPESAAFLEQHPINVWPTLMVLEPRAGKSVLSWAGSATVAQLEKLFEDGERAVRGDSAGLEGELARADALNGDHKPAEAAQVLARLLKDAPADWSRRSRVVESLLFALMSDNKPEECARVAVAQVPRMPRSASFTNAVATGLDCALSLPRGKPGRQEAIAALEPHAVAALGEPVIEMAADDRSAVYEVLAHAREDAGDTAGRRARVEQWVAFLERDAARATTPEARAAFDPNLLSAYTALGELARALPMLEASEKALPGDYNPPARRAAVLRKLGRYDEALAANDRALALVYGPRKVRVLSERAEILLGKQDRAGARRALEEALAFARSLPPAQTPRWALPALEKKLTELK